VKNRRQLVDNVNNVTTGGLRNGVGHVKLVSGESNVDGLKCMCLP